MIGDRNIEEYFRRSFDGYRVAPSGKVWKNLARKLALQDFFRFSISSLNVYYVAFVTAAGLGAWLLFGNPGENKQPPVVPQPEILEPVGMQKGNTVQKSIRLKEGDQLKQQPEAVRSELKSGKPEKPTVTHPKGGMTEKSKTPEVQTGDRLPENVRNEIVSDTGQSTIPQHKVVVVAFESDRPSGCPPLEVRFTNRSAGYRSLLWDFGDGHKSREPNPAYIFTKPGQYPVRLNLVMEDGSKMSCLDTVTVFNPPVARFDILSSGNTGKNLSVNFYNNSVDAVSYLWDFGDNTRSTVQDPVHHYKNSGPFDVKLKVWSEEGCVDSMVVAEAVGRDPYFIRFPDAFMPNPNGPSGGYYTSGLNINEVFHPEFYGVMEYNLSIYNRFGALIFESNDVQQGWDGYINGTLAKPDVYIWKAHGRFENGKPFMLYGNLTLVKK